MRAAALILALLGACTTTVRDLPAGQSPEQTEALLAGSLAFGGTKIDSKVRLRSIQGKELVLRPEHGVFLVSVPPGTYTLERFGSYAPKGDRPTIEAKQGAARYIGSFEAARDPYGGLLVVVKDNFGTVADALRERYRIDVPYLEPGLARSSLDAVDARPQGELVIAVERVESPVYPILLSFGFSFGYHYGYHGHGHHGHSSGHRHRGSHRTGRSSTGSRRR